MTQWTSIFPGQPHKTRATLFPFTALYQDPQILVQNPPQGGCSISIYWIELWLKESVRQWQSHVTQAWTTPSYCRPPSLGLRWQGITGSPAQSSQLPVAGLGVCAPAFLMLLSPACILCSSNGANSSKAPTASQPSLGLQHPAWPRTGTQHCLSVSLHETPDLLNPWGKSLKTQLGMHRWSSDWARKILHPGKSLMNLPGVIFFLLFLLRSHFFSSL